MQAKPFLQYHLLPPKNSNNKCVREPDKKNIINNVLFFFKLINESDKFLLNNLLIPIVTKYPTITNKRPTTNASISNYIIYIK